MLARWFDRSGIGQFLAPDEKAAKVRPFSENDEAKAPLWQILAPDPNFAPKQAPPAGVFPPHPDGDVTQVLCIHCNQWTPVGPETPKATNKTASSSKRGQSPQRPVQSVGEAIFHTPSPNELQSFPSSVQNGTDPFMADVNQRVLSAAKDTASSFLSPKKYRDDRDFVFRSCTNVVNLKDRVAKKFREKLVNDPTLLRARSTLLGISCLDGFTPLHGAAYAGHVQAAKIILDAAAEANVKDLHLDRDLQGRCALSIAAEAGAIEMVQFLLPLYEFASPEKPNMLSPQPIDLMGRTPLGRAMTSPNPKARSNRKRLENALFSPKDLSILGTPKPLKDRMGTYSGLNMAYGTADMPGIRVIMEDSFCSQTWEQQSASGSTVLYSLLGVCDGHDDRGTVSQFVASNVAEILRGCIGGYDDGTDIMSVEHWQAVWYSACLQLDDRLKQASLEGGSTAVFALITEDVIVVANVGDSRCILIQAEQGDGGMPLTTTAKESSEPPTLQDEHSSITEGDPKGDERISSITTDLAATDLAAKAVSMPETGTMTVKPLSFDHKPDLPEEMARIEKAGLKVISQSYEEEGQQYTVHKVAKTENDLLAVSRAFGDFEYKSNTTLGPEDQAVSCIADVQVHKRDPDRDQYLVLACDGIWDVMDNNEVMDFVLEQIKNKTDNASAAVLPEVSELLVAECLKRGSRDNMSAILVKLHLPGSSTPKSELPPPKALEFVTPTKA
jgi:serine/threonine protein phosphatase PrpC